MRRKVGPGTHAGEMVIGMIGRQLFCRRPAADPHHARLGVPYLDSGKAALDQCQVLLRRQAPDVQANRPLIRNAPALAQCRVTALRVEQFGIDPAPDDTHAAQSFAGQVSRQCGSRHHGRPRPPVQAAQVGSDGRAHPAQAVMQAVAVEIGMEARRDRDAETACRADSRPAKRPFGNDMHQVRLAVAPFSMQPPAGRQAETQAGVAGQRQARQGQFVLAAGIGLALARADNAHAVATFTQAADQAPHRHGDTVDLGWKGFSDESDIERGRGVHEVSCCNDRLIGHRYSRMTVFFTRLSSQ